MIHILFQNILYPDVTRFHKVYVGPDLMIHMVDGAEDIALPILQHPTVEKILAETPAEKKSDTEKSIVYQVFNFICQRFTGKSLVDGVLITIENDVLNLDGALFTLRVDKEEKKDDKSN